MFKVGDKVRVNANYTTLDAFQGGDLIVIDAKRDSRDIWSRDCWPIIVESPDGARGCFSENELDLVQEPNKFKVGDKVILNNTAPKGPMSADYETNIGKVGVIAKVDLDPVFTWPYVVKFANETEGLRCSESELDALVVAEPRRLVFNDIELANVARVVIKYNAHAAHETVESLVRRMKETAYNAEAHGDTKDGYFGVSTYGYVLTGRPREDNTIEVDASVSASIFPEGRIYN
jgi:hypothetical protein